MILEYSPLNVCSEKGHHPAQAELWVSPDGQAEIKSTWASGRITHNKAIITLLEPQELMVHFKVIAWLPYQPAQEGFILVSGEVMDQLVQMLPNKLPITNK